MRPYKPQFRCSQRYFLLTTSKSLSKIKKEKYVISATDMNAKVGELSSNKPILGDPLGLLFCHSEKAEQLVIP